MKKIEKVKILFDFLMDLIIEEDEVIVNPSEKILLKDEINDSRTNFLEAKKLMDKLNTIDEEQNIKFKEAREDLKKYNDVKKIINEIKNPNVDLKKEVSYKDEFITLTSQEIGEKEEYDSTNHDSAGHHYSECTCDNSNSEYCSDCNCNNKKK